VTAAGTLNLGFGNSGFVRGYDLVSSFEHPVAMVRTANGGLLLMGNTLYDKIVLWRVTASGLADTSLGAAGRLEIDRGDSDGFRLAALSDGSIALVSTVNFIFTSKVTTARVSHFDANGAWIVLLECRQRNDCTCRLQCISPP
jgi:hypothetical protein